MGNYDRKLAICLALTLVFALRAMTPAGYMPGAPGSGLLFELCPDQLPVGVSLAAAGPPSHAHHGHEAGNSSAEADHCQIGHLLISLIAAHAHALLDVAPPPLARVMINAARTWLSKTRTVFQSRGPPSLVMDEL